MNQPRALTTGYGAVVTAMIALLCYVLALKNGFAFDDVVLIPSDARVTNGQFVELIATPYWKDVSLALYRPLTSLSFGVDWFIGNGAAAWFHFTNVLWHVMASVLTYVLLVRYFSTAAALAGAVVFAAHPVHVEAVANVVGRGELIAATLVLMACVVWPRIPDRTARALITAVLYFLALCAKEGAAVLPALLVMLDGADGEWRLSTLGSYLRRRAPELLALVCVFGLFMLLRTSIIGSLAPARLDPVLEVIETPWHRILTALQVWPLAARLLIFPWTLLSDYGPRILMPVGEWNSMAVLGATMVIALLGGGLLAAARGHGRWALGLLWYPIAILPVSNFLIPIGVMLAERTLYLPSVALSFAIAALFAWLYQKEKLRRPAIILIVLVTSAFAVRTAIRVPEWRSTDEIMLALVRDRPDAFRGRWHVARMMRARGDVKGAVTAYEDAMVLWPLREGLVLEAALYASAHGQALPARRIAEHGTRRWPQKIDFHRIAAGNAIDAGDTAVARRMLLEARQLHPNDRILNEMWQAITTPSVP